MESKRGLCPRCRTPSLHTAVIRIALEGRQAWRRIGADACGNEWCNVVVARAPLDVYIEPPRGPGPGGRPARASVQFLPGQ